MDSSKRKFMWNNPSGLRVILFLIVFSNLTKLYIDCMKILVLFFIIENGLERGKVDITLFHKNYDLVYFG